MKIPTFQFRGKSLKTGDWVYGYYFRHDTVKVCFTHDDPKTKHYIIRDGFCDWGFEPPVEAVQVDPDTIQEFRGEIIWTGEKRWEPRSVEREVREREL